VSPGLCGLIDKIVLRAPAVDELSDPLRLMVLTEEPDTELERED